MHTAPMPDTDSSIAAADLALVDVSVVIVNYNVRPFLEQALSSVYRACEGLSAEVFVVDNNSVDGSSQMVRERFPDVRLIENEENVGFARANNQAFRRARGRFLLVLNPDTIVQEDTIATLLRFMEKRPDAGAVGCQILNPDGSFAPESRRTFPSPSVAFYRITGLSRMFPRSRVFGRYNLSYLSKDAEAEVDALSGSCMLVRRAALAFTADGVGRLTDEGHDVDEVWSAAPDGLPEQGGGPGYLDESFFMYGEDLDWCYRIQQAGWRIYYTPETQIIHYKGESTKQAELRYVRLFYGAMLRFSDKHFHGRYSHVFAVMLRAGIVLRAGLSVVANTFRRLRRPLGEWIMVALIMAAAGAFSAWNADKSFAPVFYTIVAPLYAALTVCCIAAAGGYGINRSTALRPVLSGVGVAFIVVSVVSFFVKAIAYSRAMVLLGFVGAAAALLLFRWFGRNRRLVRKRALLVGRIDGARRLQRLLAGQPEPPLEMVGYVPVGDEESEVLSDLNGMPRLGSARQLRDVVRLRRIDDVVFSASDISNQTMFRLVHQLRGLPVRIKVFTQDSSHIIGKAWIEDLSTPMLVGADTALSSPRPRFLRRISDITVSLTLLALLPIVRLVGRAARDRSAIRWRRAADRIARTRQVLRGDRSLVGFEPDIEALPPDEWSIGPGVFPIVSPAAARLLTADELNEAYWLYAQNQSLTLDLGIVLQRLRAGE